MKLDITDNTVYQVARMLDYEMENLRADVYQKADLLVMFKYVLEHANELRDELPIEEETYNSTQKRFVRLEYRR